MIFLEDKTQLCQVLSNYKTSNGTSRVSIYYRNYTKIKESIGSPISEYLYNFYGSLSM